MSLRPRRSVLYMPGANSRAMEKAKSLPADSLVMDLEDAVSPDQKESARQQVADALNSKGAYGKRELVVRINGLDTQWSQDDTRMAASLPIDAVCIPKVETAEQVQQVVAWLDEFGAVPSVGVWAMIETPKGVTNVDAIAAAHPRLQLLLMGTSDLAKELRVPHTPDRIGFLYSLSRCVVAARENGIDAIDGVHLALDDEEGLRSICEQGRNLGFDGKSLIHPKQIGPANDVFGPSEQEVDKAQRIIEAFEQAQAAGQGVVVVDGKLVEVLHVEEAKRTLAIARAIAAQV